MKVELIAGNAFVRAAGRTRPMSEVLVDMNQQANELSAAEQDAVADIGRARRTLANALVSGESIDRDAVEKAETAHAAIREQQAALTEQFEDLRQQFVTLTATAGTDKINKALAALAKTYDSEIRRIAA